MKTSETSAEIRRLIEMARDWTDPVVVRDAPERVPYVIEQLIETIEALLHPQQEAPPAPPVLARKQHDGECVFWDDQSLGACDCSLKAAPPVEPRQELQRLVDALSFQVGGYNVALPGGVQKTVREVLADILALAPAPPVEQERQEPTKETTND